MKHCGVTEEPRPTHHIPEVRRCHQDAVIPAINTNSAGPNEFCGTSEVRLTDWTLLQIWLFKRVKSDFIAESDLLQGSCPSGKISGESSALNRNHRVSSSWGNRKARSPRVWRRVRRTDSTFRVSDRRERAGEYYVRICLLPSIGVCHRNPALGSQRSQLSVLTSADGDFLILDQFEISSITLICSP